MNKFLTLILLILIACFLGGIYGSIHDQISYTISPEYYTKFKFYQFGLMRDGDEAIFPYPRLQVSIVGFMATWWTGIPVGIVLGVFGLHSDKKVMMDITIKAFLITILISFVTGVSGLYEGYFFLADGPKEEFSGRFIPGNLNDFKSFIAVGAMHHYSYLGGFFGLFAGIAYIVWRKGKIEMSKEKSQIEKSQLSRIIYIVILSLLTIFIWAQLYYAQFLAYDENYGLLIQVFILSVILFVSEIVLLFRKAKIVKDNFFVTIVFLVLNSPFIVVLVVMNYKEIFGVALEVG